MNRGEKAWALLSVPQTMLQLKKIIGCCLYFEEEGFRFETLEGENYKILRDSYANMKVKRDKVRLMCLRMIAYTAEKDANTKECVLFCTACLEEDKSMDDMRLMCARACSSLALQQGMFSDAVKLLEDCPDLASECQLLKEALSISYTNASTATTFVKPKSAHKLLVKGDSPLATKIYARLMKSAL